MIRITTTTHVWNFEPKGVEVDEHNNLKVSWDGETTMITFNANHWTLVEVVEDE